MDTITRYDYDYRCQELVIRMPTGLHNTFIKNVSDDISDQLQTLAENGNSTTALFARSIICQFATRIEHNVGLGTTGARPQFGAVRNEPDLACGHKLARYSGVVIEVSYSQKAKSLSWLAENYILDSEANTRVVVGLDIEYLGSKKATMSVWRPQIINSDIGNGNTQDLIVHQVTREQVRLLIVVGRLDR